MSEDTQENVEVIALEETGFLYDAEANQKIPLTVVKGGSQFNVAIELSPFEDDEWFELMTAVVENAKRVKTVSVDMFAPLAEIGRRKAVARYGYTEKPDWRKATRDTDFISAVKGYLNVEIEAAPIETSDLLDDDEETPITLFLLDGETKVFFREEKKAEMDEFLAANGDLPSKSSLASHAKLSKERRLYALFQALQTKTEGYKDRIPAWQAVAAVSAFLNLQLVRMGKL